MENVKSVVYFKDDKWWLGSLKGYFSIVNGLEFVPEKEIKEIKDVDDVDEYEHLSDFLKRNYTYIRDYQNIYDVLGTNKVYILSNDDSNDQWTVHKRNSPGVLICNSCSNVCKNTSVVSCSSYVQGVV